MLFLLLPVSPTEAIGTNKQKQEPLDVTNLIMTHIQDSYEWHVTDIGQKNIIIHLPIIVKSTSGWHVFSSEQFSEEPNNKGYRIGPDQLAIATVGEHAGKIVEIREGKEILPFDISITKTVAVLFIDAFLLLLLILLPARWYRRHKASDAAPGGFTGLVEMLVMYVEDNVVKPGVGEGYQKYSPYLLTCFFFILICNLMGVVPFPPGGGNVTGNISITLFLALCTFIITQFSGSAEGIGVKLYGMTTLSVVMSIFMMCLELMVCFIQAFVFTMLSSIFIGLARAKAE